MDVINIKKILKRNKCYLNKFKCVNIKKLLGHEDLKKLITEILDIKHVRKLRIEREKLVITIIFDFYKKFKSEPEFVILNGNFNSDPNEENYNKLVVYFTKKYMELHNALNFIDKPVFTLNIKDQHGKPMYSAIDEDVNTYQNYISNKIIFNRQSLYMPLISTLHAPSFEISGVNSGLIVTDVHEIFTSIYYSILTEMLIIIGVQLILNTSCLCDAKKYRKLGLLLIVIGYKLDI